MGLKHMTCDIVLHTALPSEPSTSVLRRAGQKQTPKKSLVLSNDLINVELPP